MSSLVPELRGLFLVISSHSTTTTTSGDKCTYDEKVLTLETGDILEGSLDADCHLLLVLVAV